MPELPEVETTVRGLKKTVVGKKILDVWTDLSTKDKRQAGNIANPKFFPKFRKSVRNSKILSVERRAKNILINLSGGQTILIHMKMTGHLLYGKYGKIKNLKSKIENWVPAQRGPLTDPYNKFLHVVFILSGGKHLAFSDARKFGKTTLIDTETAYNTKHLNNLGPEPLDKQFTIKDFKLRIGKRLKGRIKAVLMDQSVVAGIGNIYSDEILWRAGVHPERQVRKIKEKEMKLMFRTMKETLFKGIDFGGDSMSDYRNLEGGRGKFQEQHKVYQLTGEKCTKPSCRGIIKRIVVAGRSAHFCPKHQK
jgi:formamidopyrimidine-DNA glycosylase